MRNRWHVAVAFVSFLALVACGTFFSPTTVEQINNQNQIHEAKPSPSPSPSPSPGSASGPWDVQNVIIARIGGPAACFIGGEQGATRIPNGCGQADLTATPKRTDGTDANAPGASVQWSPLGATSCVITSTWTTEKYNLTVKRQVTRSDCTQLIGVTLTAPDGRSYTAQHTVIVSGAAQ